jgi:hypothetical protein
MFLDGDKIVLHDNCFLIIPPFKRQEWHVQMEELDYTFLIFQDIYNFISDKYFNSIARRHRHNIGGNEYLYGRYAPSYINSIIFIAVVEPTFNNPKVGNAPLNSFLLSVFQNHSHVIQRPFYQMIHNRNKGFSTGRERILHSWRHFGIHFAVNVAISLQRL